ncbi:MAG: ZIP family metal transporter [Candidatus Bathyarchaeota archaeon]|nr:MAG: ZIP family metal transporter [Candidatus Bathyarchaeota archaeon]
MSTDVVNIVLLSTVAGLGTGLGGLLVLIRKPGEKLFVFLIGLAAGLMIMLSFMELLADAMQISGLFPAAVGFIAGLLILFILDFLLPHKHIISERGVIDGKMLRTGMLIAIGISFHNLPEGIAVASGYSYAPRIGVIITIAIALHNIPEGMAIALPIRLSGASRWGAFRVALLSGLTEPAGAVIAAVFLSTVSELMPFALSFAAGVMVFITVDELIPIAHEHGHEHFTSFGLIVGFILTLGLLAMIA